MILEIFTLLFDGSSILLATKKGANLQVLKAEIFNILSLLFLHSMKR